MQPFRVTCETCQSRLKIRSPEVIGEIHACPKCGSMVQIVPPPGWIGAATVSAPMVAARLSSEPALTISNTVIASDFHIDEAALLPSPEPAAAPSIGEPPVAPPISEALPAAMASRSPILIWSLSGAALVLVGGLAVAFSLSGGTKNIVPAPVKAASSAPTAVVEPLANKETAPATSTTSVSEPPVANDHVDKAASSEPSREKAIVAHAEKPHSAEPDTHAAFELPPNELSSAKVATAAPPAVATSGGPSPLATTENVVANSTQPIAAAEPVLKFDPLDFDPARLSSATGDTNAAVATGSIPQNPPDDSAVAGDSVAADESPRKTAAPPIANPTVTIRVGPVPAEATKSRSDAQKLALKLDSVQMPDVPLTRFIDAVSDMSGAPITLDPIALELAGVSKNALVSVDAQGATLEKLLRDALAKNRLELIETDGRVSIGLPNADERGSVDHDVADLANSDAAQIAKLIEQFVTPSSWKSGGGAGAIVVSGTKLQIENTLSVRRQALMFCERLRLARGLPVRSKYPAELLSVASPYQTLAAKLNEHATFTFLPWARLADVVHHWQESTGLTIPVDWSALADAELSPSSPVACSAVDRTWQDALAGILEPLGLGWWAVNGDTIQITSRDALSKIERIEFYAVPKPLREQFASGDALVESLTKELNEQAGNNKTPAVHLQLDEPSGRLIVRGVPDAHRFLTLRLSTLK